MSHMTADPQAAIERFRHNPRVVRLIPGIQYYAWGDHHFIADLLGTANPQHRPMAELWMGAHPDLPSGVEVEGTHVPLDRLLQRAGESILGPEPARRFCGKFPYLLKVISAATPLSIQVHPTQEKARKGFHRENAAGIPLTADNRNYKDGNHKPELVVALTDFYGLRGFRPLTEIARIPDAVPELRPVFGGMRPTAEDLETRYHQWMSRPQPEVDSVLAPLLERLAGAEQQRPLTRTDREHWVLRAGRLFSVEGRADRGILSIYLLNLVHLLPGEGMYLPAGVLHAYLEGAAVEVMANSNNVLRGGLTSKHVDIEELIDNVAFSDEPARRFDAVRGPNSAEWSYETPAEEFALRRIEIGGGRPYRRGPRHGVEILLVTRCGVATALTISAGERKLSLQKGSVVLVPHGIAYTVEASSEATLYAATVP